MLADLRNVFEQKISSKSERPDTVQGGMWNGKINLCLPGWNHPSITEGNLCLVTLVEVAWVHAEDFSAVYCL